MTNAKAGKVRVDKRIWTEWGRRSADNPEWELQLLLTPTSGLLADVEVAARESLRDMYAAYSAREAETGEEPPFPGEWAPSRVRSGVRLQVLESEDFESALPRVVSGLERRGINGRLSVWERPRGVKPPVKAHLLHCRATVRGVRIREQPRAYRWFPDTHGHAQLLAAADRWCRRGDASAAHALTIGLGGPIEIEVGEPIVDRMRDEFAANHHSAATTMFGDGFRSVVVQPYSGRLSLVAGRLDDDPDWWRTPLAELTGILREHAASLVYGFVRRGWNVTGALFRDDLPTDWPRRKHDQPGGVGFSSMAFDDLVAPDPFGVQFLGPGFAARIEGASGWRIEPASEEAVILTHEDPATWFAAPFVPYDPPREPLVPPALPAGQIGHEQHDRFTPPVLLAARSELSSLLCAPGALMGLGFPDVDP